MPFFINKKPDKNDLERLKLLLSTFTDGTGENGEGHLPGGFNFERVIAEWIGGVHILGSKQTYDVAVEEDGKLYGYSCKMRGTLDDSIVTTATEQDKGKSKKYYGDCTIEVSNAGATFIKRAEAHGVNIGNINSVEKSILEKVGLDIVQLIESWYHSATTKQKRKYEKNSFMLHLAWSKAKSKTNEPAKFKLFVFNKHVPDSEEQKKLIWGVRPETRGKKSFTLIGQRKNIKTGELERAIEIYLFSGGHVKYYPRIEDAIWTSGDPFELSQAPTQRLILSAKAYGYWEDEWIKSGGEIPTDEISEKIIKAARS